MSDRVDVTVLVCGGQADAACPAGGDHDDQGHAVLYSDGGKPCGESVACSKCGSTVFDRDLMRLP
jgi:hypothetical protein